MFYFSKVMTAIIMPPGLILLVMAGLLFFLKRKKTLFLQFLVLTVFFYALSIRPVSDLLLSPLESYVGNRADTGIEKAELIVVPGGGSVIRRGQSGQPYNSVSAVTASRVLEGLLLHGERGLPLLFSGGNVLKGSSAPGESEGVETILQRFGLSPEFVYLESESRNSYENALLSAERTELRDIILVTSAFHMKRSVLCFESAGFRVVAVRAVDYRVDRKVKNLLDYLPSMEALQNSRTAIHEYLGLFYYRLVYLRS